MGHRLWSSQCKQKWKDFVVQSLSVIWVFETPRTVARQASLPFTISQNFLQNWNKNKNNFVTNADVHIRGRIKNKCDYETIEKVERRIRGVSLDVRHYLLGQSLYLCIIFLIDENCNLSYISWGLSIAHHFFQQYICVYMYVYMLACINCV